MLEAPFIGFCSFPHAKFRRLRKWHSWLLCFAEILAGIQNQLYIPGCKSDPDNITEIAAIMMAAGCSVPLLWVMSQRTFRNQQGSAVLRFLVSCFTRLSTGLINFGKVAKNLIHARLSNANRRSRLRVETNGNVSYLKFVIAQVFR